MIKAVCKQYALCSDDIPDLEQECYFALLSAIRNFNPEREALFTTCLRYWVKHRIIRYQENCCSSVRVPVHAHADIKRYKRMYQQFICSHGRKPTDAEICEKLRFDADYLKLIRQWSESTLSLAEKVFSDNNETTLEDTIASGENIEETAISAVYEDFQERLLWSEAKKDTSTEEYSILKRYYRENKTLKEIAEEDRLTRDKINYLRKRAIQKLRRNADLRERLDETVTKNLFHGYGVTTFRRSGESAVERAAIALYNF